MTLTPGSGRRKTSPAGVLEGDRRDAIDEQHDVGASADEADRSPRTGVIAENSFRSVAVRWMYCACIPQSHRRFRGDNRQLGCPVVHQSSGLYLPSVGSFQLP